MEKDLRATRGKSVLSLPTLASLKRMGKHNEVMSTDPKDRTEHVGRLPLRLNLGRYDYS